MLRVDHRTIQALAARYGLVLMGSCDIAPLQQDEQRLQEWQDQGFCGEMGYMRRSPQLLARPLEIFSEAQSVASFALFYSRSLLPERDATQARVARYAWGRDYHRILKKRLLRFVTGLEAELGKKIEFRVFADAVPLLERALAAKAGLGFVGKNTMLIIPGQGSFHLLCEVLWDLQIEEVPPKVADRASNGCGTCVRCLKACPTEALVSERRLDARRCISYLTIEKTGMLLDWERKALGEWILGCDLCQEICPFNYSALKQELKADLEEFSPNAGAGPLVSLPDIFALSNDDAFLKRFAGTPFMRPGREGVLRNGLAVAANSKALELLQPISGLAGADSSEVVRASALACLGQLSELADFKEKVCIRQSAEHSLVDSSAIVQDEAKKVLQQWV